MHRGLRFTLLFSLPLLYELYTKKKAAVNKIRDAGNFLLCKADHLER